MYPRLALILQTRDSTLVVDFMSGPGDASRPRPCPWRPRVECVVSDRSQIAPLVTRRQCATMIASQPQSDSTHTHATHSGTGSRGAAQGTAVLRRSGWAVGCRPLSGSKDYRKVGGWGGEGERSRSMRSLGRRALGGAHFHARPSCFGGEGRTQQHTWLGARRSTHRRHRGRRSARGASERIPALSIIRPF